MGLLNTTKKMYKQYGLNFVYAGAMFKLFRKGDIEYKLKWKNFDLYGNNRTATWATYNEVLIGGAYDFPVEKVNTIIDLGANVGVSALFFNYKYPNAQIIAVEPAKENLDYLYKNISCNNIDNVFVVERPVWDEKQILSFTPGQCSPSNVFSDKKSNDNSYESITMPQIIEVYGIKKIDILKIDIEGGEIPVLTSNNDWLDIVDNIFMEIHSMIHANLGSVKHAPIIFKELEKKGFVFEQMKEGLYWFQKK